MSISESTYLAVKPKKNDPIEPIAEALQDEEIFSSCYHKGLDYLSRRQYGEIELNNKLVQKGFSEDIIERSLVKIKSLGYINDEAFIRNFVRDKQSLQKWGKQKIISELHKKGINLLDIEIDEELEYSNAIYHVKKKVLRLKENDKNIRYKIKQNLLSKGYNFSTIEEVLKEIDIDKIQQNH